MTAFHDIAGLAGCALAITVLASRIPGVPRMAPARRFWLMAVVFMSALLPVASLPLAGYVRGVTGDLSITTVVLLAAALAGMRRSTPVLAGRERLLWLVVVAAAALYPLALGWGGYDPYRLGYGSFGLLALLLVLALLAHWRGVSAITISLALAVLAWSGGWYESTNLWDYLLDPLVAVYAAGSLALRRLRARRT